MNYDFPTLVQRVIQQESGGNPNAVSPVGAMGLMQVMPGTARSPGFGISPLQNPFDPNENRRFGEQYLQAMLNRYDGDQERALVAYNWGPGNADKWSGDRSRLPEETQGYLRNILGGDTPQAVARDTRAALGFGAGQTPDQVSTRGAAPMMPQREQPQGLLQSLGIQKMGEGPEGDKRFFQRDQFKDTMGNLAIAANTLRQRPDQNVTAVVGGNRQRREANRTADWLGQQEGGAEFAQMIASGANPAEVLMAYRQSRQPVAPDQTSAMQNHQFLLAQGTDPQTAMDRAFSGGNTNVTTNVSGPAATDPFAQTLSEAEGEQFVQFLEQGAPARRNIARLDQLEGLLENVDTGFSAAAKTRLGEMGIAVEGLDDLQAAQALINSMVPEQRQPGSGPMSDADLALFKQSVPRLINQPGGNAQIIRTMRQINEYDAELARIAQRAASGEITRTEARELVNNISNPLEDFADRIGGATRNAPPPSGGGDTSQMSDDELLQLYLGGN